MEESEGLAYDDPHSDSNATITGTDSPQGPQLSSSDEPADSPPDTLRGSPPCLPGSPMEHMPPLVSAATDMVEVHAPEAELETLVWPLPEHGSYITLDFCDKTHAICIKCR